jgi:hypothetical protein
MLNRKVEYTPGPWFYYTGKLRPQFPTIVHEIQADDGTAMLNGADLMASIIPSEKSALMHA